MPTQRQVSVRRGMFETTVNEGGQGTPLLYLHNLAAPPDWYPFLDLFAERYRVIYPWHPGFGSSRGIEYIDDPIDIVVYYNDLLDELGIERAHVVGHELGGMFAAELAALSPDRVNKLVLAAPYGLWLEDHPAPDRYATPFRTLREMQFFDPTSEVATSYGARPADPSQTEEFTIQANRALATGSRFLWHFPDRGLNKRIHRIKAPTLLVWGEKDGLIPLIYARAFEAAIPQSDLVIIERAANLPMLEQPQAFVEAVARFLG